MTAHFNPSPERKMSTSHYPRRHFRSDRAPAHACRDCRNEPGVLARIAGLFSGRGYNIESLTVTETEHESHVSRITVITSGSEKIIEQIKSHLERLVPVHRVVDLTLSGESLEREMALVKVVGQGRTARRGAASAAAFGARTLDATLNSFVFEITARPKRSSASSRP